MARIGDEHRTVVSTTLAPSPHEASSQCINVNGILFLSSQLGKTPEGKLPPEFGHQMINAIYNCKAILESGNSDLNNVVKVTIYLTDGFFTPQMEEIYSQYFAMKDPPVMDIIGVSSLPSGALVSISVVAAEKMTY